MADGVRIGGAFYEITAEAAPLIQAMAQAEARAKATSQAIAQATGLPEKAVQRYANAAIREHKRAADASAASALRIIKAHNDAAAAADKAAQAQVRSTQQASNGFSAMTKGVIGFTVAAAGIATGAAAVHQALTRIATETQKATQAQFGLQAAFKTSTERLTAFSQAQGAAIGRTPTEIQQAIILTATLAKNYGFTDQMIQVLIARTADYAALTGREFLPAVQDVVSAMRGEGDAAERLGLALQKDALKGIANLTAEQKKNFDSLSVLEHSQIAYAEFLRQTSDAQGTAAQRTTEAAGAYQNLDTATKNLSTTLGEKFAPAAAQGANRLTELTNATNAFIKAADPEAVADFVDIMSRFGSLGVSGALAEAVARRIARERRLATPGIPDTRAIDEGRHEGADVAEAARIRRAQENSERETQRRRAKEALEAADKANDAVAESAIKAIDKEKRAKERWYDEERSRIEARRTYQLEDIETRRDAAIKALEEEKQAAKDAIDAQIEEQERLKDARLAAAAEAADRAKRALDAEKERLDGVRDLEDRARDDEREAEDRALEDARRAEDRARDAAEKAEIKRLERLRDERVAAIEDEIEQVERATEKRLRNIDREADRARAASDKAMARLERRGEEEDEQHRRRMQALDDEQDAQLAILDAQLKALDVQEKQSDAAERVAGLQKRIAEAQRAATAARGTGTPEQIAEARGELTRALRGGDEVSIANARERLVELAGRGNEAIREADEELAEAQAELAKESVDTARDAERDKLKAAQDAIRAEIEGRKREAEEEDRRRKQSLERDQENERAKLASRLARLEKQKQAEQDEAKEEVRLLRNGLEEEKRAAEERLEIARRRFADDAVILEDRRREEDRFRADQREAQDRFRADERAAEDKALKDQLDAVNRTLAEERVATEAHFNGPNGTITQLRRAVEASNREYDARLDHARKSFEDERKAAERVYTNTEGNGLLDLLAKARADEFEKLEKSKEEWREWSKTVSEEIKKALADLDGFISRGANIPRVSGSPINGPVSSNIPNPPDSDVERFIRNLAPNYGIPAADALAVWSGEGRSGYVGDHGSSFGPYQLHVGGLAPGPNAGKGLGDQFIKDTGLDPRDPSTWKDQIYWVFDYVKRHGWNGQWHGAPSSIKNKRYAMGGWISEPVVGMGARSGAMYQIAEREPEIVVPASRMIDRRPLLGPAPASNYAAMGAALASVHPGGGGGIGYQDNKVINVNGVGVDEFAARIRREEHKRHLLRGVGRGR